MAVATQARPQTQTRTVEAPSSADMEKVLLQTEQELAAMRLKIEESLPGLSRAVATSTALQRMRKIVTVDFVTRYVIPLMGSPMGFMTDRKPDNPYSAQELIEPTIQCLMTGFNLAGNEWNVIAGRFYGAQAGYRRLFRELPGVTDLKEIAGEPIAANGNTCVRFCVQCKINGQPWALTNEKGEPGRKFTIRVNSGMGPDAIIGKAARKAFKAAYDEITGTCTTDSDDIEPENGSAKEIPLGRSKIGGNGNGHTKPAPGPGPLDTAGGEIPNETTTEPSVPAGEFDQDAADSLRAEFSKALSEAMSLTMTNKIGEEIGQKMAALGTTNFDELMAEFRAKSAEILSKKK